MNSPTLATRTTVSIITLLVSYLLFPTLLSLAADGDRDPDFGAGITFTGILCDSDDRIEMLLQPDGCVLVAGIEADVCVARLLPDGSPDPGFGLGGVSRFPVLCEAWAGPALAVPPIYSIRA